MRAGSPPEKSESQRRQVEVAFEQHFSVEEIAKLWHFGVDKIRSLFLDEPDVILEGPTETRYKRPYQSMRISASAARRVHARLTSRTERSARRDRS